MSVTCSIIHIIIGYGDNYTGEDKVSYDCEDELYILLKKAT